MNSGLPSPPLIVHVIYALGTGGLENGLVNIINRMPAEKYRHAIVCLTTADEFARRITVDNVQVVELRKKEGHDLGLYWRLWKTLRSLKPAIVHSRNLAALETQWLGLFMPSVKRVHGEHGRDVSDLHGRNWKYLALRRFMRLFVHRYVAVSQDLQCWLLESVGVDSARVSQIYNGVDHSRFQGTQELPIAVLPVGFSNDETVVIGAVGRLAEVKNQASILRALRIILDRFPRYRQALRMVLVGDGPLLKQLQSLAEELELDELVWFAGDRNDVPDLLRHMQIFLLPSLGEGISNTLLEAMAMGLPVIATEVGGNPELVTQGENGLLVPVADDEALAEAILELLENPTLRRNMGREGERRVRQQFDWDHTVAEYMGVYDSLLSGSVR